MTDDPRSPTPRPGTGPDRPSDDDGGAPVDGASPADADRGADPLDELASALLDGEIDGDDAEAALRRPDVAARVTELAAARDAVRSFVPPPDPARRESAVAAALAAFDADQDAAGREAPGRGDDLAAARAAVGTHQARSDRRVRAVRWLGAAAAAIVVAVAGVAVALSARRSDQDVATSEAGDEAATLDATAPGSSPGAGDGADREGAASDDGAAESQSDLDAGAAAPEASGVLDLGAFSSAQALLDEAAVIGAGGTAGTAARSDESPSSLIALRDRCATGVPTVIADAGDAAGLLAWGTVAGERVEVWLGGGEGDRILVALDASCSVVATRPAP